MKIKTLVSLIGLLSLLGGIVTAEPLGTAFTYQGRLTEGGNPANGLYDFYFVVYGAPVGGDPIASALVTATAVSNGLFMVTLDFGSAVFTGDARWLEIIVSTNITSGNFTLLSPRQELTATPYALYARAAGAASNAVSVPWAGVSDVPAGFADGADNDTTYSNGEGLLLNGTTFSINMEYLYDPLDDRYDERYWSLTGNYYTTPAANFLGTKDNQPLELRVNNQRGLRLEPGGSNSVNVIGGWAGNSVAAGVVGATVAGGGAGAYYGLTPSNRVDAHFGTVSGGAGNAIQVNAEYGTIGGGNDNALQPEADWATIGGGQRNTIQKDAFWGTIAGGNRNTIQTNAYKATISGGDYNTILPNANHGAIGGGYNNLIESSAANSTISGGSHNTVGANASASVIGGGRDNAIRIGANDSSIGGGNTNLVESYADYSTISGGRFNRIGFSAYDSAIGGGYFNTIETNASTATIAGGYSGAIGYEADFSAIGGGYDNSVSSRYSTVGGGEANSIATNSQHSTVGGGKDNTILTNAECATIPGGQGALASHYGQLAYASGAFATGQRGSAQASQYVLRRQPPSSGVWSELFLDGSSQRMVVPEGATWTFDILIAGSSTAVAGRDHAAYHFRGAISRLADDTVLLGLDSYIIHETDPSWEVRVRADDTNEALVIEVSHWADSVVKYVASVRTVEVDVD